MLNPQCRKQKSQQCTASSKSQFAFKKVIKVQKAWLLTNLRNKI